MGSGIYTAIAQMAAETLRLPIASVEVVIGDTVLPQGPISAGSQVTQSIAPAVAGAAAELKRSLAGLLMRDADLALNADDVEVSADGLLRRRTSNAAWRLDEALAQAGLDHVEGYSEAPGLPAEALATGMGFGAIFAEATVDPDCAVITVRRMTAAFAAGRIVNPVLARSQYISGLVGRIGMALQEETNTDPRSGRIVGPSLAEYLFPVHADMPRFDILMIDEVDDYLPDGIKGVGMLGHVGSAVAIANAVHQAVGKRVRHLPIRVEDLI